MVCILTGTIAPSSARANIFTYLFKNTDDLPTNWQATAKNRMGTSIAQSPDLWLKQQKEWVLNNPEEARYVRTQLSPPQPTVSNTTQPMQQRSTKELVQEEKLKVWEANNPEASKIRQDLYNLIKEDKEYATLLASLSKQWDQKHQYRQFVEKNPKTAIAATGAAAGIAGGAGITYAIMKPEKGSTVTVTTRH